MAINKDSNAYTLTFAIIMVVIVGTILALLSVSLKPMQKKNAKVKMKMDILSAMMSTDEKNDLNRGNTEAKFDELIQIEKALVLDMTGAIRSEISGKAVLDVNIRKERRDKTLAEVDKNYPLFIGKKNGETMYVIPVVGNGLWGPIWGNVSLGEDLKTIKGASFGHKGETPGLGAEITQGFFIDRWIGEEISVAGEAVKFEVVKNGSGSDQTKVDGITGGTITSVGVQEMVNRCMKPYVEYFKTL